MKFYNKDICIWYSSDLICSVGQDGGKEDEGKRRGERENRRGEIIGNRGRGDGEMDCISVKGAWQGSINWKRQATDISRSGPQKKGNNRSYLRHGSMNKREDEKTSACKIRSLSALKSADSSSRPLLIWFGPVNCARHARFEIWIFALEAGREGIFFLTHTHTIT